MRLQLFEFEDYDWFPDFIRHGQTDYLHFMISLFKVYKPAAIPLKELIESTGITEIQDVCSGGGGGMDTLRDELEKITGKDIRITLSDKYPNKEAFEELKKTSGGKINYIEQPVDVLNSNTGPDRIRTIFSAFHHFKPADAEKIIADAVKNKSPLAIFEGAEKNLKNFIGILIFTPVIFFFITPFMKPFRFSRLFFTYIIPLIPFATTWDGIVSVLRMYSTVELMKMAKENSSNDYKWKTGILKNKLGTGITYLTGYCSN